MKAVIIGAGIGGLYCGAKLARAGNRVLILEKNPHVGGTSHIFKRGEYFFPMGPLAFSFPSKVKSLIKEAGVQAEIKFTRNDFQLLTSVMNLVYSQPLRQLREELERMFPQESAGIKAFTAEMQRIISLTNDIVDWHPSFLLGRKRDLALRDIDPSLEERLKAVEKYSDAKSAEFIDSHIGNQHLRNLLGSQGTFAPELSMLNLAFMWNVMSEEGIWSPSCGIHGLSDMLKDVFLASGGEIRSDSPVKRILVEKGVAVGVVTENDEVFRADWVVSNADQKKTFLELLNPEDVPPEHLDLIKAVPYTDSELCVYLGVDPKKVNLDKMRADHLFFRKEMDLDKPYDPEDFDNKEIEICLWTRNNPDSAPQGGVCLILRVDFPHEYFAHWRTGEKRRREGYKACKEKLAWKLIETVETVLPGLASSIEVMETATPLTYQDWGNRFLGSIAGWTWSAELARRLPGKLLIETPISHLLMVGIYAASELYMGGVPTSMHTSKSAADLMLER